MKLEVSCTQFAAKFYSWKPACLFHSQQPIFGTPVSFKKLLDLHRMLQKSQ